MTFFFLRSKFFWVLQTDPDFSRHIFFPRRVMLPLPPKIKMAVSHKKGVQGRDHKLAFAFVLFCPFLFFSLGAMTRRWRESRGWQEGKRENGLEGGREEERGASQPNAQLSQTELRSAPHRRVCGTACVCVRVEGSGSESSGMCSLYHALSPPLLSFMARP